MIENPFQIKITAVIPIEESFIDMIAERVAAKVREPKKVEQKFYSRDEVCGLLHITYPTLKKLSDTGVLNPIKMGDRRILFDAEQIQQLVDSNVKLKHVRR